MIYRHKNCCKTTAKVAGAQEKSNRRGTKAKYEIQCLIAREDINSDSRP
ncbi:MAG: hypothetical protein MGU50_17425 [Trichodesmium sp. MAG_R02]|nr:hypothetical protein [Trichodesmium sp. MAG_R02]